MAWRGVAWRRGARDGRPILAWRSAAAATPSRSDFAGGLAGCGAVCLFRSRAAMFERPALRPVSAQAEFRAEKLRMRIWRRRTTAPGPPATAVPG